MSPADKPGALRASEKIAYAELTTPADKIAYAKNHPGKWPFGNSLFLSTRPPPAGRPGPGKGYWIQQYRNGTSFSSKSLGTLAKLNSHTKAVTEARRFHVDRDRKKATGEAEKAAGPLFSDVVAEYLDGYSHDGHRVPGKAGDWRGTSEADKYRRNLIERGKLSAMPTAKIEPQDIAAHLRMFEGQPKTAERVRGHVFNVMAFAIARKFRSGDNPASVDGPIKYLPWPKVDQNTVVTPHPAMPFANVPAVFRDLQTIDTPAARALSFIILTGLRVQEVAGAKWGEIDVEQMIWTIPGSRMKGKGQGREHAVPLTPEMLRIIGEPGGPEDYIFPGDADGHVGDKNPLRTLRSIYKGEADVHGMRSTFSDYVVDHTDIPDREALVDLALGHLKHRDKTQRAYLRSTRLEQRRPVMQRWSEFVTAR